MYNLILFLLFFSMKRLQLKTVLAGRLNPWMDWTTWVLPVACLLRSNSYELTLELEQEQVVRHVGFTHVYIFTEYSGAYF